MDLRVLSQLTTRDRQLLHLLAEHQVLTTGQITAVAFDSPERAQHRTLALYRLGVLDRFRWHQPRGSQPFRYTLGPVGVAIIAAGRGVDPPSPAVLRRRVLKLATNPHLGHLLGVNDFFVALLADARHHTTTRSTTGGEGRAGGAGPGGGRELREWWSERHAAAEFDRLTHPDGYGRWIQDGKELRFFLEHDTGTEPLHRLIDKLPGYADLATAGGPTGPVLFALPGARREAELHRRLERHPPPVPVATTAERLGPANTSPADAVWLLSGTGRRRRLIDLPDLP